MNYLRTALSDARQRYSVNRIITEILLRQNNSPESITQVVNFADRYPDLVLTVMRNQLSTAKPDVVHRVLILLETLVAMCNYNFHISLAHYKPIQDKVLALAIRRAEDAEQRRTQHLARLTLLEYSRIFRDDVELAELAQLATLFEFKTHKNLMRCLNVHRRRVRFKDPCPTDVVLLRNNDSVPNSGDGETSRTITPIRLGQVEVCPCSACGYLNAPTALVCASCETHVLCANRPSSDRNKHVDARATIESATSSSDTAASAANEWASAPPSSALSCASRSISNGHVGESQHAMVEQGSSTPMLPMETPLVPHEHVNGCVDVANSITVDKPFSIAH